MRMGPRQKDQTARRINVVMKWHLNGNCKSIVKWFLVWVTGLDMLGDGLISLRVYMVDMEAKEMLREEVCLRFVRKKKCA